MFARTREALLTVVNDHAKEVGASRRIKTGTRLSLQLLMTAIEAHAENADEDAVRRLINRCAKSKEFSQ